MAVLAVLCSVLGLPVYGPHHGVAVKVETLLWPPRMRAAPCPSLPATHLSTTNRLERRGAELPHPSLKALQVPANTLKSPCACEEIPSCPQQRF